MCKGITGSEFPDKAVTVEYSTRARQKSPLVETDPIIPLLILHIYFPVAKRLFPRIFLPYLKKIYGNGNMARLKNASKLEAH
jgi:hypothetical protein